MDSFKAIENLLIAYGFDKEEHIFRFNDLRKRIRLEAML